MITPVDIQNVQKALDAYIAELHSEKGAATIDRRDVFWKFVAATLFLSEDMAALVDWLKQELSRREADHV